jgi:hypothetical protein
MPQDNPLVVGSPYPLLPIWSTVTLKFIEARDVPVVDHHLGTLSAQSLGRPRPIIAIDRTRF